MRKSLIALSLTAVVALAAAEAFSHGGGRGSGKGAADTATAPATGGTRGICTVTARVTGMALDTVMGREWDFIISMP